MCDIYICVIYIYVYIYNLKRTFQLFLSINHTFVTNTLIKIYNIIRSFPYTLLATSCIFHSLIWPNITNIILLGQLILAWLLPHPQRE